MNTAETQTEATPAIDPCFLHLLQQHRGGDVLNDMALCIREATEAVQLLGKPATITLKLAIRPAGKAHGAVTVQDDIKMTLPKQDRPASFFFADDKGNLLREDPRQTRLPLRMVAGGAVEEVNPANLKQAIAQ